MRHNNRYANNRYGQANPYGIGPGTEITPEVREEAMTAPLFALGGRDWFYVAVGAAGLYGAQRLMKLAER